MSHFINYFNINLQINCRKTVYLWFFLSNNYVICFYDFNAKYVSINKAEVGSSEITEVGLKLDGRFSGAAIEYGLLGLRARRSCARLTRLHCAL